MSANRFRYPLLCAMVAALSACGGGDGGAALGPQNATLNLGLTDGPVTQAQKVYISFTGVELKPANDNAQTINFATAKGFDLLTLQNGNAATLLPDTSIPAGDYEWVRLMVDVSASYIDDAQGLRHSLLIPSGAETGLKLVRGFTMPVGGRADFTLDFVLSKSVTAPPGQGGNYLFKPVVRLIDNVQVGTLAGTFATQTVVNDAACASRPPVVYLFSGAGVAPDDIYTDAPTTAVQPLTTATAAYNSSNQYAYRIGFVPAGSYTVAWTCNDDDPAVHDNAATPAPITFHVYPQAVTVTAKTTTTADF